MLYSQKSENQIYARRTISVPFGLSYIRKEKPLAAQRFRRRAEQTLRRLDRFPNSGRRLPEFPDLPHREVIVAPYLFFYRIQGEFVWIVAVWHGAQLPKAPNR
jgi:plasmid stabilization system protein ParE